MSVIDVDEEIATLTTHLRFKERRWFVFTDEAGTTHLTRHIHKENGMLLTDITNANDAARALRLDRGRFYMWGTGSVRHHYLIGFVGKEEKELWSRMNRHPHSI